MPISPQADAEVKRRLGEISVREEVSILYACESGSRAWGFASTDSDYDVRFLYLRRPEWYLSIDLENRRDVIEDISEDGLWDLSGWDLRKALKLLLKSNPPLFEWLYSPIVYLENPEVMEELRHLASQVYAPRNCHYHYLQMATGNFNAYLRGETINRKKYLYVLRPLLAVRWIETHTEAVPVEFHRLLNAVIDSGPLRQDIDALLEAKKRGKESENGLPIPRISMFIEEELDRHSKRTLEKPKASDFLPELNAFFRKVVGYGVPK